MNVLIVLAHPEPQSFNAHLAQNARDALVRDGHTVELSDLYASNFDPRESASHFAIRRDAARFDAAAEQRFSWDRQTLPAPRSTRSWPPIWSCCSSRYGGSARRRSGPRRRSRSTTSPCHRLIERARARIEAPPAATTP